MTHAQCMVEHSCHVAKHMTMSSSHQVRSASMLGPLPSAMHNIQAALQYTCHDHTVNSKIHLSSYTYTFSMPCPRSKSAAKATVFRHRCLQERVHASSSALPCLHTLVRSEARDAHAPATALGLLSPVRVATWRSLTQRSEPWRRQWARRLRAKQMLRWPARLAGVARQLHKARHRLQQLRRWLQARIPSPQQ